MKRRFTLLLMATLMWVSSSVAEPIDVNQARLLAKPYMKDVSAQPSLVKKGATQDNNQPIYIFSRGKGQGFVIVSGDDGFPSILGYAESGDFVEEQMPPQLLAFLDTYRKMIVDVADKHMPKYVNATANEKPDIAPLIKTHWHQDSPYNLRCPLITSNGNRSIVGCVATAASQVIYYFHKDAANVMQGSTPTYTYGDAPVTESIKAGTPLKWDLMQNSYSGSEPQEYRDAVATFCFAVGAGTWLTYGSSTGGHIYDLPATFTNYFGLTGKHMYMSSTTQAGWENHIYEELQNKRPMVFSGYTSDWSTGHAIVLDGYQQNGNLFHFNFGWGGQADGYYTIVDGRGPGSYGTGQEIVYAITPKKYNLTGEKIGEDILYHNRTNTLSFMVANNGTLDYSGIYMFCSTNSAAPSKLSAAVAKDENTVIANDGKSIQFDFTFKPIIAGEYYIYLTDKNLNVLSKTVVKTTAPQTDLHFRSMALKSASEKEGDYALIYNTKAEVNVELIDKSNVPYEGSLRMDVYGSDDKGATFSYVGYTAFSVKSDGNSSLSGICSLSMASSSCPIKTDTPYYAVLQHKSVSGDDVSFDDATDTIVRFIVKGTDLSVKEFADGCLSLQGHWNESAFASIAKKSAYADAACYDLTAVEGVDVVPTVDGKPNAVFYVSLAVEGQNAVFGTEAKSLYLTAGKDFLLRSDVNAESITVDICQEPNKWYLFTSPATLAIPDGIIARTIDSHSIVGIYSATTDVTTLEPGRTYMMMTSSSSNQTLRSTVAGVCTSTPVANPDTAVVGTFASATTPAGAMLINLEGDQYFTPVEEGTPVDAFRGYFHAADITKAFTANAQLVYDPPYLTLGQAIERARTAVIDCSYCMPADTTAALVAEIEQAEHMFTYRTAKSQEIKSAAAALQSSVDAYLAKVEDIKKGNNDYTSYIANPSFETGNTNGWDVESTKTATVRKTTSLQYKGVGADGTYLMYAYDSSNQTGPAISQTISDLPAGIYSLSAMLGTDEGHKVVMFANEKEVEVDANSFGQYYLTKATIDSIAIKDGESLTICFSYG
ncbi:MAG: C10 family peptidase, partial [Prevotellaceae bacterium]|nr:C10 family peptidase [Prevotellaceae bacterium]